MSVDEVVEWAKSEALRMEMEQGEIRRLHPSVELAHVLEENKTLKARNESLAKALRGFVSHFGSLSGSGTSDMFEEAEAVLEEGKK